MKTLNEEVDELMVALDKFEAENGPEMLLMVLEAVAMEIYDRGSDIDGQPPTKSGTFKLGDIL